MSRKAELIVASLYCVVSGMLLNSEVYGAAIAFYTLGSLFLLGNTRCREALGYVKHVASQAKQVLTNLNTNTN